MLVTADPIMSRLAGLTNAVDLELASHMTECFDQSLVVPAARCFSVFALASAGSIDLRWGFSVELARAIAMSRPAMSKQCPSEVQGLFFSEASPRWRGCCPWAPRPIAPEECKNVSYWLQAKD